MNIWLAWFTGYLFAVVMMLGGWIWQQRYRNIGIVDVLWAVD